MIKRYPSDISREEYEKIMEELEGAKKVTRPRRYDLYDIFCEVLYIVKEGCTWRGLPHDYPKWQNVRYHYDIWTKEDKYGRSLLDKILDKLVEKECKANGRESHTTMVIVDSKSIKNTSTAKEKGYDVGKKLLG